MFTSRPSNWEYTDDMELMWLFFQCSEEMLKPNTVDTYRVPVHNTISLIQEIRQIHSVLGKLKIMDKYYQKYIPVIIDELVLSIHNDCIIKKYLGYRLESVLNGLAEAQNNSTVLIRWIDQITQSCSSEIYLDAYKRLIIDTITENKNKAQLIQYSAVFFTGLIQKGYSIDYLYKTLCKFFCDKNNKINSTQCVKEFLKKFDYQSKQYKLIAVVDSYIWKYFCSIDEVFANIVKIEEIDEETIKAEMKKSDSESLRIFLQVFNKQKYGNQRSYIQMISCDMYGLDPYEALASLNSFFELLQDLQGYFKHKTNRRIIFDSLYLEGDKYFTVKEGNRNHHRPYISQQMIDKRIMAILSPRYISRESMSSLINALRFHSDAIGSHNDSTKLRTFWTALEALFSNQEAYRENALHCMLHIIQKTYLLKLLKTIYFQLRKSIPDKGFWVEDLRVDCFKAFLNFFIEYEADSMEYKKIYAKLNDNPLMRTRLFQLRKELSTGKNISKKLRNHEKRIYWQLMRIYRTRNLSTHSGVTMPCTEQVLFNLHNYFDYAVNFILCKLENEDSVNSIASLIFETKNDNEIHLAQLKNSKELNMDNGLLMLFGPDYRIIDYDFEFSN